MSTETTAGRSRQQTGFQVRLSNFEGPFDLLLQLIFAHRLDVTEVALHQVTDDFIAYTKAIGRATRARRDHRVPGHRGHAAGPQGRAPAARRRGARRGGPGPARGARPAVRPAAAVPRVQARRRDVRRARGRRAAQLSARGGAGGPLRRAAARGDARRRRRERSRRSRRRRSPRGRCRRWHSSTCTQLRCRCPNRPSTCWTFLERRGIGQWATFSELVADCGDGRSRSSGGSWRCSNCSGPGR